MEDNNPTTNSTNPVDPLSLEPVIIPIPLSVLGGDIAEGFDIDGPHDAEPRPGLLEEQILNHSFQEQAPIQKVAHKDFINSLSIQKVNESMVEQGLTCGICLESFQLGEDVVELPCQDKHYFHIKNQGCDGIYPWLKNNSTCPLCRHSFPSTEVKIEPEDAHEPEPERSIPIQPRLINIQQMIHDIIQDQEERMLQESILNSLQ